MKRMTLTLGIIFSLLLAGTLFAVSPMPTSAGSVATDMPRHQVRVAEVNTTPGLVEPIDVLTLNTTVQNDSERADGLVVEIIVKDPHGDTVQNMRQRNVGVDANDDMAVYWVWRIPQRVAEGTYSVHVTVYEPDGVSVIDQKQRAEAFGVKKSEREMAYY